MLCPTACGGATSSTRGSSAAWLTLARLGLLGSLLVSYATDVAYLIVLNWTWLKGPSAYNSEPASSTD